MSNFQTRKYESPLDERTLEFGKKVIRLSKSIFELEAYKGQKRFFVFLRRLC